MHERAKEILKNAAESADGSRVLRAMGFILRAGEILMKLLISIHN
jgi:hypothetical protein